MAYERVKHTYCVGQSRSLKSGLDDATVGQLPVSDIRDFTVVSLNQPQDSRPIAKISPFIIVTINPGNAELNPICHLLALLGAHRILHISRIRVNFI